MRLPSLTYANVMSTLGVFLALGGTSYAVASLPKNSVGERQVKASAITSDKIRDGEVTAADLAPGALKAGPRGPRGADGAAGTPGAPGAGSGPAERWQALSFVEGWTNYPGTDGFEGGSFRKDQLGVVHLRGMVTRATGTPVQHGAMATLPAGYRPQRVRVFGVHTGASHLGGRVDVHPDGDVVWIAGATNETDYVSLEGVSFEVS